MQLGSSFPKPSDGGVLWVVDSNHPFVDACTWMDDLSDEATQRVDSLDSLVTTCQRFVVGAGAPIDFLAIFGHGNVGYQAIGGGKVFDSTGDRSLYYQNIVRRGASHLRGRAEGTLSALNGVLSDNAKVLLAGCSVAKGADGEGLITTVSRILNNRPVLGFANDVYWWMGSMSGTLKTARGRFVVGEFAVILLGG